MAHSRGETPERTTASEAFEALAPEWAALHAACGAAPFTHPAWHETWLRHFGAGIDPVYLAVRMDGRLAGVMALDMARGAARTLGDVNVRDYGGPLAAPGFEAEVARGILEWLDEDLTGRLELNGMLAGGALCAAFEAVAEGEGWTIEATPEAVCPGVVLPGDFESFVAALPKHDRHELRRKLRNLRAAGDVSFANTSDPDEVAKGMHTLVAFMRASHEGKDEFLTPVMEAFFHDLADRFARLGLASLGTLLVDGAPAAMLFAFEAAGVTYLYNSGYDPAYGPLAAGLLSKALAIEDAIARGQRRFDFLRGEEEYKRRLGGQPDEVLTLRLRKPSLP